MRILQVSNGFPPESFAGVELHTLQVCQMLRERHRVAVFCRMGSLDFPEYVLQASDYEGLPIWRVNNNFLDCVEYAQYYRQKEIEAHFRKVLAAWRPDIVHFQHCVGLSAALPAIASEQGVPSILTLHDYWYICPTVHLINAHLALCPGTHHAPNCFECLRFADQRLVRLRRTWLYPFVRRGVPEYVKRLVDRVLSVRAVNRRPQPGRTGDSASSMTDRQQKAIADRVQLMRAALRYPARLTVPSVGVHGIYQEFGIPAESMAVIPLGMEVERWRGVSANRSYPLGRDGLRFAYMGSLLPHKGVDIVLNAFRRLSGAGHQLHLYGFHGVDARFARKLKELIAADPRIALHASYSHAELPQILGEMDVLLMPALWPETYSFVIREALLAGVWVLASNIGVMCELIRPGENGRLVSAGDMEAWVQALQMTVQDWPSVDRPPVLTFKTQSFRDYADEVEALYLATLALPQ